MSRSCRKCALLVAAVAGVVAVVFAFVAVGFSSRRGGGGVALTYQGRTNFVSPWTYYDRGANRHLTGQFAFFTLHNHSGRRIGYMAESVEVQTSSGWVTNQILRQTPTNWFYLGTVLSAGSQQVFLVPLPSTNEMWKIRLTCFEKAPGWEGLQMKANDWWHNLRRNDGVSAESWTGQHFQIASPIVSP